MLKAFFRASALLLGSCLAAVAVHAGGDKVLPAKGTVARVIDGDTIELQGGERVRLAGINAPEYQPWKGHVEPYGKEAGACAEEILAGRSVRLETDVERRDKYGRLLAYVYLEDGTMVNEALVAAGCARARYYRPNGRHRRALERAQKKARAEFSGLWSAER